MCIFNLDLSFKLLTLYSTILPQELLNRHVKQNCKGPLSSSFFPKFTSPIFPICEMALPFAQSLKPKPEDNCVFFKFIKQLFLLVISKLISIVKPNVS